MGSIWYVSTRTAVLVETGWTSLLLVGAHQRPSRAVSVAYLLMWEPVPGLLSANASPHDGPTASCLITLNCSLCPLDPWRLMHLYNAKKESTAGSSKPLPAANFLQFFSHLVRQTQGTAIRFCLKHFLLLTKDWKDTSCRQPPLPQSLTKVVLELPSLCLTRGWDEEWKALPSFPPQDKEKSQNIPDGCG